MIEKMYLTIRNKSFGISKKGFYAAQYRLYHLILNVLKSLESIISKKTELKNVLRWKIEYVSSPLKKPCFLN